MDSFIFDLITIIYLHSIAMSALSLEVVEACFYVIYTAAAGLRLMTSDFAWPPF